MKGLNVWGQCDTTLTLSDLGKENAIFTLRILKYSLLQYFSENTLYV